MKEDRYQDRWRSLEPDRLERYKALFEYSPAADPLIAPADIGDGHVVVDLGCGPGSLSVELAKRVGPRGHVHAIDVNADFVQLARERVSRERLGDRVTVHLEDKETLPLASGSVDRLLAKNVLVYVEDPAGAYREFRRVLKPGGIAHAVDSDWDLAVAEPVPPELWKALLRAVRPAFRHPNIGRALFGYARAAGFGEVKVQVLARADTEGRLLPVVKGLCEQARTLGTMGSVDIERVERIVEQARGAGALLVLNPQFMVTAKSSQADR
jgi:SAM-dependent methyltransferase